MRLKKLDVDFICTLRVLKFFKFETKNLNEKNAKVCWENESLN